MAIPSRADHPDLDPSSVVVGKATIPYHASLPGERSFYRLPGGGRTVSRDDAIVIAKAMDAIMRRRDSK